MPLIFRALTTCKEAMFLQCPFHSLFQICQHICTQTTKQYVYMYLLMFHKATLQANWVLYSICIEFLCNIFQSQDPNPNKINLPGSLILHSTIRFIIIIPSCPKQDLLVTQSPYIISILCPLHHNRIVQCHEQQNILLNTNLVLDTAYGYHQVAVYVSKQACRLINGSLYQEVDPYDFPWRILLRNDFTTTLLRLLV